MCGIIGIAAAGGHGSVAPQLFNGLCALAYRGYDTSGMSVFNASKSELITVRTVGHPEELTKHIQGLHGFVGIAHTRWATHAHPINLPPTQSKTTDRYSSITASSKMQKSYAPMATHLA